MNATRAQRQEETLKLYAKNHGLEVVREALDHLDRRIFFLKHAGTEQEVVSVAFIHKRDAHLMEVAVLA
jgi:predicted small metal-binding protein